MANVKNVLCTLSRLVPPIKGSGSEVSVMAMVFRSGQMAPAMRVSGATIVLTGMENSFTLMATSMREIGSTIRPTDSVPTFM